MNVAESAIMMSAKDAASLDPLYYNKDQFVDTKEILSSGP